MLSHDYEIKITGRAKDTIVLLGGENIEPAPIERAIKACEYVEAVVVLGQDKKYLAALIVPAKEALLAFAGENDLPADDYETLLDHPRYSSCSVPRSTGSLTTTTASPLRVHIPLRPSSRKLPGRQGAFRQAGDDAPPDQRDIQGSHRRALRGVTRSG
jgi:acyl-CoA synthetase (AMP-forming)/AMP-acid ligase II